MSTVSFAGKAVVGLIINKKKENAVMGIMFNNVANLGESAQFDLAAAYPIFNDDLLCKNYLASKWPVFYIACTPGFINSVNALPAIGGDALDMAFWSIKDGDKQKSVAVIFGEHHAYSKSIIEHSDMRIGHDGEVYREVDNKVLIDIETYKHYG